MGVTFIKTVRKPSYLQQSIPDAEKRAAKTQGVGDSGSIKRMQEELEGLRNEIAKKNRDQLDMMYNLDFDNFSEDTQALFQKWSDGTTEAMAYFKAYATENESKWTAYAKWRDDTTKSIATVSGTANANSASITQLVDWKKNTAEGAIESIAGIQQTANANSASIQQIVDWKTETADGAIESIAGIRQTANANGAKIDLLVTTNSSGKAVMKSTAAGIIVEAINNAASSIKISADHIQISGETEFITAADLSDSGSTLVSGNRIRLVTEQGNKNGTSRLSFVMKTPTEQVFAYMDGGDLGSGAENDARYRVRLMTKSITVGGEEYYPAIYLYSAGGISLDANTSVYVYSATYTTANAHYNTRVTANMPYSTAISAASASKYDYVFCTDGIYYNGKNICPTSGNSSTTQEVQS
nr:MAG TPA: hypothetical protein [Caudoviricetes sp.]